MRRERILGYGFCLEETRDRRLGPRQASGHRGSGVSGVGGGGSSSSKKVLITDDTGQRALLSHHRCRQA